MNKKLGKDMDEKLIINARRPEGELGSQMIEIMNESHVKLSSWCINHLNINDNDITLDIGCGGGVNVKKFSEMTPNGKVYGLDYSKLCTEKSSQLNELAINNGKVEIIHASVSQLPFKDETFDIVTAFQSTYFWSNFNEDLKEVNRVLKPNGLIFICNGDIKKDQWGENAEKLVELLDRKMYSKEEFNSSLSEVGFSNISIFNKEGTNCTCVIASKI
ncbi:MAG: class I SAM-dependent methyltransferase [Methanobacteriaceae archaeon]|jgi:ubiquinone/menaquinone biosynthesis C-methylase UbiE|nr:class I SAM-dependent methyltransferase [Candidatus Methanorudis spinitermitis]